MRRWFLVISCLLAAPVAAQPGQRTTSPLIEPTGETTWPSEERGFGVTVQDAKNDAVKHLTERLRLIVRQQKPPLYFWRPTPEYVKRHLIQDEGRAGPDFVEDQLGATKTWIYKVKPLDWPTLIALDQAAQRAGRRFDRIIVGIQVFGGLVLLLVVLMVSSRWAHTAGVRVSGLRDVPFSRQLR